MRSRVLGWGFAAFTLVTALPVLAQGVIYLDSVQFVRTDSSWDDSPWADLKGVSAPLTADHLSEFGWWFRASGDTQETAFPLPDLQLYIANVSRFTWSDVGGRGLFSAVEDAQVFIPSSGPVGGWVSVKLSVENISASPLGLEIFAMADFDLQPNFANDTARLVEWTPNRILQFNDTGSSFAQFTAFRLPGVPNAYLVRPYGAAGDVGAVLSDAAVTNFDDSGVPFGPGDVTAGWQFSYLLPASYTASATVYLGVNSSANCSHFLGVFCDGFERVDTSIWSAVVP